MILNLLILLFSIPIITSGSALFAAAGVLTERYDDLDVSIRYFFNQFKLYFTQSMKKTAFLILLIVTLVIFGKVIQTPMVQFIGMLILAISLIWWQISLFSAAYFRDNVSFQSKVTKALLFKFLALFCLGTVTYAMSTLFVIFLPKLFPIWLCFGISLPFVVNYKIYDYAIHRMGLVSINGEEK